MTIKTVDLIHQLQSNNPLADVLPDTLNNFRRNVFREISSKLGIHEKLVRDIYYEIWIFEDDSDDVTDYWHSFWLSISIAINIINSVKNVYQVSV